MSSDTTVERASGQGDPAPHAHASGGRDRLLDLIRSVAIVRVVMWHTWSWPWLTWVPAMPAMFFTTGALLEGSLARRGWLATLRLRLRRLLLPYWVYAAACVAAMALEGWRPSATEALAWVVPLWDPVGSDTMPGLWIPLWYVRAYLWFLIGAGVLSWLQRRLGGTAVVLAASVGCLAWWLAEQGVGIPFAVGDALAYAPFVLAGMAYSATGRRPSRASLLALGVAAGVAAVVIWQRFGPADAVVNRSYLLTMLVGAAGLSLAFAWRRTLLAGSVRVERWIDRINRRALTIYLWQGFGLVAAQRLVDQRIDQPVLRAVGSITVVAVVIVAAVVLVGGVEDLAARRDRPRRSARRSLPWVLPGAALVVLALGLPLSADDAMADAPLSGRAVVARAGMVEDSLAEPGAAQTPTVLPGTPVDVVLEQWAEEHAELLAAIGFTKVEIGLVDADGGLQHLTWPSTAEPYPDGLPWWSMTKVLTTAWLVQLDSEGVVSLDDPLARWVPEAPNASLMTLEQMARHTAGIPTSVEGGLFEATPVGDLQRYRERPQLLFEPGQGFAYSRVGYLLLAQALERASGVTWVDHVESVASAAGVQVRFDEPPDPDAPVTDPDGHGYRGGLWSSGGLITGVGEGARLVHWLFTEGLDEAQIATMATFSDDPDAWYYGLALLPVCPCEPAGDGRISAARYGLDAAPGSFVVDPRARSAVLLRPDQWWVDDSPGAAFYELQNRLLDSVAD